ncbi:MAG: hypothetical protein HQL75_05885 [Magnetococcales bacterium]|nr:hypothetical protein [Magnetococcales bacterium]
MKKLSVVRAAVAAPVVGLLTMGGAEAALDVTGVQTALDTNISVYETVGVAVIGFVLAVAVIYGIIGMLKGRAK